MKLPTDQETQAVLPALDPTQFLKNRLLLTTLGSAETAQQGAQRTGGQTEELTTWQMRTMLGQGQAYYPSTEKSEAGGFP